MSAVRFNLGDTLDDTFSSFEQSISVSSIDPAHRTRHEGRKTTNKMPFNNSIPHVIYQCSIESINSGKCMWRNIAHRKASLKSCLDKQHTLFYFRSGSPLARHARQKSNYFEWSPQLY